MQTVRIFGGEVLAGGVLRPGTLILEGDRVARVGAPTSRGEIDARDLIVAPGFIDLQINGAFGVDFFSEPEGMWRVGAQLPAYGVTSFLPTMVSSPESVRRNALAALGLPPARYRGATALGLHLEGPFLNPDRRGAHPADHLARPSKEISCGWSRDGGVALVTLAPELPGAVEIIRDLVAADVVVSAGHTQASADDYTAARDAGLGLVTHLFNAMAPLHHREAGLLAASLADRSTPASLIVDGVHVVPQVVCAAWNAKGPGGIALVTDAVSAMEAPSGQRVVFAGRPIAVTDTGVRDEAGILSGSNLTMDQAVRNLVAFTGCEPAHALEAAATVPADILRDGSRGRITPGAIADLVLLNRRLEVVMTLCGGRIVHVADGAAARCEAIRPPAAGQPQNLGKARLR